MGLPRLPPCTHVSRCPGARSEKGRQGQGLRRPRPPLRPATPACAQSASSPPPCRCSRFAPSPDAPTTTTTHPPTPIILWSFWSGHALGRRRDPGAAVRRPAAAAAGAGAVAGAVGGPVRPSAGGHVPPAGVAAGRRQRRDARDAAVPGPAPGPRTPGCAKARPDSGNGCAAGVLRAAARSAPRGRRGANGGEDRRASGGNRPDGRRLDEYALRAGCRGLAA